MIIAKIKERFKNRIECLTLAPMDNIKKNYSIIQLKKAMKNKKNFNIALSGKYGAGKSSILKTYFKNICRRKKTLYISLGMLGIKNNKNKENVNVFCQEIEKSIIQQIIYKEKKNKLPNSGIKRISKISNSTIFIITIIIGVIIGYPIINKLYELGYINLNYIYQKFNSIILLWNSLNLITRRCILCVMLMIVFRNVYELIFTIVSWFNLNRIKISFSATEIELNEKRYESLINKYMDELVYFFSVTKYNTVVIEDLDRFLENNIMKKRVLIIFQKLKELNTILNSSKDIERRIVFLYAIKDNVFINDEERTKFFDCIVPVIPIMSNYSSYAELKKLFKSHDISDRILLNISLYINDFRVAKNLKNEYVLYNNEISGKGIDKDKLLGMIALKNIRPNSYEELLKDKGNIYNFIKNKENIYEEWEANGYAEIKENNRIIKDLKKEELTNIKELKQIALGSLIGVRGNGTSANYISIDEFLEDDYDIEENINIRLPNGSYYGDNQLFEVFGSKENFISRMHNIIKNNNNEIDALEKRNLEIEQKNEEIRKKRICELVSYEHTKKYNLDDFESMLIVNGYIDENYKDYMFKYVASEGMSKNDYEFIRNVKQKQDHLRFDYEIDNPKWVEQEIDNDILFSQNAILNYNLFEYLLSNWEENSRIENRLNRVISLLTNINDTTQDFLFGFIKNTNRKKEILKKLYSQNRLIFKQIFEHNKDNISRLDCLIKELINIPEILIDSDANKRISKFLSDKEDFESWTEVDSNVQDALIKVNVKFKDIRNYSNEFIEFIYDNNLYELNTNMIQTIFTNKYIGYTKYKEQNLTEIMINEKLVKLREYVLKNKEDYIQECFLHTNATCETEECIIDLLNNWKISDDLIEKVINKISFKIKDISVIHSDCFDSIINNNKLVPSWNNYCYLFVKYNNELTTDIIKSINENFQEIIDKDIDSIGILAEEQERFKRAVLCNEYIDENAFKDIIRLTKYIINSIEDIEISDDKLKDLVKNKKIELTNNNFNKISTQIPDYIDKYILSDIRMFISDIDSYELNENNVKNIICSTSIKINNKIKILSKLENNLINKETREYIIDNFQDNHIQQISEDFKKDIYKSDIKSNKKLELFNKELNNNITLEYMEEVIPYLPKPYNYLGDYDKRRSFALNKNVLSKEIVEKIKSKEINITVGSNSKNYIIYNKK